MAQVKKYQNASGPLPGKFTMNGKSLSGQTALDRLYDIYKDTDISEREMYNMAQRAISDGLEARYNPGDNTLQILDSNGIDLTSKYTADGLKASPSDSRFKKNWGATFKTRNHQFKVGGQRMGMVDMTQPEAAATPKTALRRGSGWFDQTSEGAYDANSVLNQDRWDIIKEAVNYATDSRNVDDFYSYDGWNNADKSTLRNLGNQFTEYKSGSGNWLADLKTRLASGTLSAADESFLNVLGFKKPVSTTDNAAAAEEVVEEAPTNSYSKDWKGDTKAAAGIGINGIYQDADGNWHINGDNFNESTWYLGGLDAFQNTPYSSGVSINGRLYTENEALHNPDLVPYLNSFITSGKAAPTYGDWYGAANQSGVRFFGDKQWAKDFYGIEDYDGDFINYNYGTSYNPDFYNYFSTNKIQNAGVQDISSQFSDLNGRKVLAYVNPEDKNPYGIMRPHYVVSNPNGSYQEYHSMEDMVKDGITYAQDLYAQPLTFTQNPWNDKGMAVFANLNTADGSQNNTVLVDRNGNYFINRGDANAIRVLPENLEILKEALTGKRDLTNSEIEGLGKKKTAARGMRMVGNQVEFHQYGGTLNRGKANTAEGKETSDAEHDITTAHKANGLDGGFTDAEKWQIGGAIADLVGIGVSFVPSPYTRVGGAVVGAGGSTSRFIGDIKQDGFQWGDLTSYITNLGLDAAGIVAPKIAKTTKGAKALRTLKTFGEPIMMALGAYGATKAANVFGKILKDEDLTSDDWKQLITGLSMVTGGTAAGVQVGKDAKTLAKTSKELAESAKGAIRTAKIGEKEISVSTKELGELLANKNSQQAVTSLLNKKFGSELNAEQLEKATKDLGLTVTKGGLFKKQDNLKFTEELPEAGSWFKYFTRTGARAKGLNALAARTTAADIQAANTALRTGNYSKMPKYKAQTIASLGAIRADLMPNVYPRGFANYHTEQIKQWTLGGSRGVRDPYSQLNSGTGQAVPQAVITKTPTPVAQISAPTQAPIALPAAPTSVATTSVPVVKSTPALALPAATSMRALPAATIINPDPRILSVPSLRTVLAKSGLYNPLSVHPSNPKLLMPTDLLGTTNAPVVIINSPTRTFYGGHQIQRGAIQPSVIQNRRIVRPSILRPGQSRKPLSLQNILQPTDVPVIPVGTQLTLPGFKQGGLLPKFQVGGSTGKTLKLPIASLMDLSSALIQNKELDRMYKDLHKAIDAQKNVSIQTSKLQSVGLDTSPITQKYNAAREPFRSVKTISPDAALNAATNMSVAQQLSALDKQEGTELSSAVTQNRVTQQNFLNQQAQLETGAANKRSQYYTGLEATDKQLDAQERSDKWANIWNTYSQSVRQRFRTAQDTLNNVQKTAELSAAQTDYQNNIRRLQKLYTDSGSELPFTTWLENTGNIDEYNKYKEAFKKAQYDISKKYVQYWAKGGKTRSVNEMLVIQGDAAAKKAVQKMNVDLMKMLLKLMK